MNIFARIWTWLKGEEQIFLADILGAFDKAHTDLEHFIENAKLDIADIEEELAHVKEQVATATVAQSALAAITSKPNTPSA